jgi:predicted aminopeptidase
MKSLRTGTLQSSRKPDDSFAWPSLFVLWVVFSASLGGCASDSLDLPYLWQSTRGQYQLFTDARPINDVISDPKTDPAVAAKLKKVVEIRDFAATHLSLPSQGSYENYVHLERDYVVWNVFAAPEFSLELKRWCFPIAGCVSYRGYFSLEGALRLANELRSEGWDVQLVGVPAYSTLGWFNDPVLSSFINYSEPQLAKLIFHELTHQRIYLRGDTKFNESIASMVADEGLQRWLEKKGTPRMKRSYEQSIRRQNDFLELLSGARADLRQLYLSDVPDEKKRQQKKQVISKMRDHYSVLRERWGGYAGYDGWFQSEIGNAHLSAVGAYNASVPAFRQMLASVDGDFERFFELAKRIANLEEIERSEWLERARRLSKGQEAAP